MIAIFGYFFTLKDLNFSPTLNWSKKAEYNEDLSFLRYITGAKKENALRDNINLDETTNQLLQKLGIPKFNRSDKDLLHKKI